MDTKQRFNAKWDAVTKIVSALVLALMAYIGFYAFVPDAGNMPGANTSKVGQAVVFVVVSVIIFITWLTSPAYYSVDDNNVTVKRRSGSLQIRINNIKEIRRIYKGELGFGLRLFGSGGLFGYLGIFYYGSIGRVNMNCTSRNNLVLITTTEGKIMVSPTEPEKFIEAVKQHIHKPS